MANTCLLVSLQEKIEVQKLHQTSVSKERGIERIQILPYSYKWQDFNTMNEKEA